LGTTSIVIYIINYENTEEAIKHGHSRETGYKLYRNEGYDNRDKTSLKTTTIYKY
jgi:hypothetical protein